MAVFILDKGCFRKEDIVRLENGIPTDTLIPTDERAASYQMMYTGNCADFLESYRGSSEFVRMSKKGRADFVI